MQTPARRRSRDRIRASAIGIAVVLLLAAGAMATARVVGESGPEQTLPPAVAVAHLSVQTEDEYMVERVFTGRVEAARRTALGFELDGLLAEVLVEEGDRVDAEQPLARLDTARLQAQRKELEAARAQAEADRALARITVDRLAEVVDSGGVSRQGLDEAKEQLRAAQAAVRLGRARLDTIDIELEKAILRAPYDGVVTLRMVDEGRVLSAGAPVIELLERAVPEVRLGIAGPLVDRIAPGQSHEVAVGGSSLPATVRAVLPARAAGARTVDVILRLDRGVEAVRPGDLVTLTVEEAVRESGVWVPLEAIAEGRRGLWTVYALAPSEVAGDASHTVRPRVVEVIHQTSDRVFVRGALEDGVLIVASGLHRVVPGQLVRLSGDDQIHIAEGGQRHVLN